MKNTKKIGTILLILSLLLGLVPHTAYASETTIVTQELDLMSYLEEVSGIRGFQVTEEDIIQSLALDGKTKNDFTTTEEISAFLGDVIKADLSNFDLIYIKYNLDPDSLVALLNEYGEELNDYIFMKDLNAALDFYVTDKQAADFQEKLNIYLANVSAERGFQVTKEYINTYLGEYDYTLDDFVTITELSDYLGDVIKADLSNLEYIYSTYDIKESDLYQILNENEKTMNDFVYLEQLETLVWLSDNYDDKELDLSMYTALLSEIGLTETEIQNLENHFTSMEEYLTSEEGLAKLEDISNRIVLFADKLMEKEIVDENYMPSEAEMMEMVSLYNEILSIFKLKVEFSIIKNGVEIPYTIVDLMKIEDLDADFKVVLYNDKSELLADIVITSDMFNENMDDIVDEVSDVTGLDDTKVPVKTVKGGELPKTSGQYIPGALFGILLSIIGALLLLKIRNGKGEANENQI